MPATECVILFDGYCNLCNGLVQFIIPRDKQRVFRFASLQGTFARELFNSKGMNTTNLHETLLLVEEDHIYTRSTAALRIFRRLKGAWPLLYAGIIIPRFLRDAVYKMVARYRYRWFGKKDSCPIPIPEQSDLFLDN